MEKPLELRIETVQHTPPQTSPRTASVSPRERKAKQNFECKDLKELLKKPQTVEVDLARMTQDTWKSSNMAGAPKIPTSRNGSLKLSVNERLWSIGSHKKSITSNL